MMKIIVFILGLAISIAGLLIIIGFGLSFFLPPEKKEVEIIIEFKREDEEV